MSARGKKRLRRLLVLLLSVFLFILFSQTVWVHRNGMSFRPDYSEIDLLPLLKHSALSSEDYTTLLLQTGLGSSAVDILRKDPEGSRRILQYQSLFFDQRESSCKPLLGLFTREDMLSAPGPEFVDLQPGDILITLSTHSLGWRHGHAGLVTDDDMVLECAVLGTNSCLENLFNWRNYASWAILRVKGVTPEQQQTVVTYATEHLIDVPYRLTAGWRDCKDDADLTLNCSYLVWYAWSQAGYDLDSDGGLVVSCTDLLDSNQLEIVQLYGMDPRLFPF